MKIKVKTIVNYLGIKYPFKNAEEWDKVGHQIGDKNYECDKIMVALDLSTGVFNIAVKEKIRLIIVHHPFLFLENKEEDIKQAPYKKELIDRLENTDISVLVLHTNYDSSINGMTSNIIKELGFKNVIARSKYGALLNHSTSYEMLKTKFNEKNIEFITKNFNENIEIEKIGIIPGAADHENILNLKDADVIITSDIKWNTWIFAKEMNIKLIQVPHSIEDFFVSHITNIIKSKFPKISLFQYLTK